MVFLPALMFLLLALSLGVVAWLMISEMDCD